VDLSFHLPGVAGCSNDKTMQKNSVHALDGTFVEPSEKLPGWPRFLPIERIKAGIAEIALGLLVCACGARRPLSLLLT